MHLRVSHSILYGLMHVLSSPELHVSLSLFFTLFFSSHQLSIKSLLLKLLLFISMLHSSHKSTLMLLLSSYTTCFNSPSHAWFLSFTRMRTGAARFKDDAILRLHASFNVSASFFKFHCAKLMILLFGQVDGHTLMLLQTFNAFGYAMRISHFTSIIIL